ncbi:MAG: type I-U CRISPR-associated protein Cas7 [Deltaproteobacteria bacterium]|nr:MAG: type I-U CRISPR-associated protein Cas7 [Deltaproteobacteria bacterium]
MSTNPLTLSTLMDAVKRGVALRANLELQPAAGPGTKVFPPTYADAQDKKDRERYGEHKYATELRRIDGEDVLCVLLDSVASQANRMELALQDGWERQELNFPLVNVDFTEADAQLEAPVGGISALQAPHRIYDAILRDSVDASGTLFRYTEAGQAVTNATARDASALYRYCPTALIFGAWDSTGPKGGLGSKFQRCVTSEIIGVGVKTGTKVGGRIDPLGIIKKAGPVFEGEGNDDWSLDKPKGKAKEIDPSGINHGNIAPTRTTETGGVTFDRAQQTTVVSLPALRRLKFRSNTQGGALTDRAGAELAARTSLAALSLAAIAGAHAEGHDLRSGALLVGNGPLQVEVIGSDGQVSGTYILDAEQAAELLNQADAAASKLGMGWEREPMSALKPAAKLVGLLAKSQALEAKEAPGDDEAE